MRVCDQSGVERRRVVQVELLKLHRHVVPRVQAIESLAGVPARGGRRELEARVAPYEPRRERPGEAGGPGDENAGAWLAVQRLELGSGLAIRGSTHEAFLPPPQARI